MSLPNDFYKVDHFRTEKKMFWVQFVHLLIGKLRPRDVVAEAIPWSTSHTFRPVLFPGQCAVSYVRAQL